MVAIPTGIISAGFVDQYSRIKRISEYARESDINFIKIHLSERDTWSGRTIKQLGLPYGIIVAAVQREERTIVPRGGTVLQAGDTMVLGAPSYEDEKSIDLKEVVLRKQHPWNGQRIRDLDISRQTVIVLVRRGGKNCIPNGDFVLKEGDTVILYTQMHVSHAHNIQV